MRKRSLIAALIFTIFVPTITSYANWTTLNQNNPGQKTSTGSEKKPSGFGDVNSPWYYWSPWFNNYQGRTEGIWQKRDGYRYYYVLPNGTDLKNGYIDGLYVPWTGETREMRSGYLVDYAMQNTFYGGQMPHNEVMEYVYEGSQGRNLMPDDFSLSTLEKYCSGNSPELGYLKNAYDWMDAQLPSLMQLSEKERAKQMAVLLAEKLTYTNTNDCGALCFHTGQAGEIGFAVLYDEFARRAGFIMKNIEGSKSYHPRPDDRWNCIVADGEFYYVDITLYKETGDEKFLFNDAEHQWQGCVTEEELDARRAADMRYAEEWKAEYYRTHPEPVDGIPISGVTNGEAF